MAYRKIEDSKLTAIADAIRSQLNTSQPITLDEMPTMIADIGIGAVPSYWQSYLDIKATEINSVLGSAGNNRSAFLWYTDAHWANNHGVSPVLLKHLSKHTDLEKTFFGGDIAVEKTGEIDLLTTWQELVSGIPNHHSVVGNHDNQISELGTAAERGAFLFDPERTGDVVFGTDATNGKNYYYIDNHIENTRYICLSTGRMWTPKDEMLWCVDVLKSTPKNWHIVVISHLWLDNDYTNGGVIATPPDYVQCYLDMFDAYNYRLSGTTGVNSAAYDFASAEAKVEFIIGGHTHKDYDFATARGIPVVLTECDAWEERDSASTATQGTITESCVYAIIADYGAKSVKVINVGRGATRSLEIPIVVSYTNVLPAAKAIDDVSKIYNDIGYKTDTRISTSSGVWEDKSETGWCTSGLIAAKRGDIIRLKNCKLPKTNPYSGTHRGGIYAADENGAFISGSSASISDIVKTDSACYPVYDADGDNIVQFTVPTGWSSKLCYIRIVAQEFTENSIITINEEIPE